jgi:hypothetical protein
MGADDTNALPRTFHLPGPRMPSAKRTSAFGSFNGQDLEKTRCDTFCQQQRDVLMGSHEKRWAWSLPVVLAAAAVGSPLA